MCDFNDHRKQDRNKHGVQRVDDATNKKIEKKKKRRDILNKFFFNL